MSGIGMGELFTFLNSDLNTPLNELVNNGRCKLFTEDGSFTVPNGVTQILVSGCGSGKGVKAGQPLVRKRYNVASGEVISFSVGMNDAVGYKDTVINSDSLGEIILYAGTFAMSIENDLLGIPLGVTGGAGGAGGGYENNGGGGGAGGAGGYGGYFGIGGGGAGGGGAFTGSGNTSGGGGGAGGYSAGGAGGHAAKSTAGTNASSHPLANNGCAGKSATAGTSVGPSGWYDGGNGADAGNGYFYGAGGGAAGTNGSVSVSGRGSAGVGGAAGKPSGGMVMFEW